MDEGNEVWATLAQLHEAKLTMADWRRHLDATFEQLKPFLMECTGEIAQTVPCPRSGQRLHVIEREGAFVAYPAAGHDGDAGALTELLHADVALWRFDRNDFALALCRALDLMPVTTALTGQGEAHLIGCRGSGEARKRVFLGYATDERDGMAFCVDVVQRSRQRCCVVLPLFWPQCDEYLRRCEHDLIVLAEAVAFGKSGLIAKQRELAHADDGLENVDVIGDYRALRLRDGTIIDLSRRTKCRAFVRHLHQRRKTTGKREFLYDEEVQKVNVGQKRILIQSGDFKFGLFRRIHQYFDLLFTSLDTRLGKYRINF